MSPERLKRGGLTLDGLTLGGLVPFSTGDFPGRLSAVLFTQGCPLRCRYCHNPHLRPRHATGGPSWGSAVAWLRRRQGLLDGVVVSGGEPTMQAGLAAALAEIGGMGFATGLHTAGTNPNVLARILPLLDWVGLDVKAQFGRYAATTGSAASGQHARRALLAVLDSGKPYEIRTTVHPALLGQRDLLVIANELQAFGIRRWVLQRFRPTGCADTDLAASARPAWLDAVLPPLRAVVPEIFVR